MAITDQEYTEWLKDQTALRVVLIEVVVADGASETTLYFSNKGYTTSTGIYYVPRLSGDITFSENLSIDSTPSISFGSVNIFNLDNEFDDYVDYIWSGRSITAKYGDVKWDISDFRSIFSGITKEVQVTDTLIKLSVRDKLEQLNTTMSDITLDNLAENEDELIPLCFGEVGNITPVISDSATQEYQVHNGAIEDIIEVRDFGAPLNEQVIEYPSGDLIPHISKDLANGKFIINKATYGNITASVQGDKNTIYNVTIANIIEHIVKTYGNNLFIASDIDATNFSNFNIDNPQQVSGYLTSRENVISFITYLASSIGASIICSRDGLLQLHQINIPTSGTFTIIDSSNIYDNSLKLVEVIEPSPIVKIGYCENNTVQQDLETGIIPIHKTIFAKQWFNVQVEDTNVSTWFKLDYVPEQKNTALISKSEALTEANRLLTLLKGSGAPDYEKRKIFEVDGIGTLLELTLGQSITLQHDTYGLSSGKYGVIIGLIPNWSKSSIKIRILV